MVQVRLNCPHSGCLTENAGFEGTFHYLFDQNRQDYVLFMRCGVCNNGIVAMYRGQHFPYWLQGQTQMGTPTLINTWPKREENKIPKHVPENVGRFYKQGIDNLARGNFDAAGLMFRKSLETAVKRLHPDGRGDLKQRIERLPDATGITPPMKEWAHEIRDGGNDAAHEEEPYSEDEAKSLQSFTELFLTYAFTLPAMLAERRPPAEPG